MKRFALALIILIVLSAAAFVYWTSANLPVNKNDTGNKIFVVKKGEAVREIGNSLKKDGLIRDAVVFFLYVKLNAQDKNIQAGDYKLSPSMSLPEIVESLNHGTLDIWVTIPEGFRSDEIADTFQKDLPSYENSWREELENNEGYLFPDTYLIPRGAGVSDVISIMKNNFYKKIENAGISRSNPKLSRIVILASLIEREAKTDTEKPLIAGIITNRLNIGMALQVDATIQYALGKENKWWPQITVDDYQGVESSYNTYLNPGLPPGPISNPGIESIKAAANPASTDSLYYLHDSSGNIHTSRTIEEHNANVAKYL
jgi:UPF0755 protein